MTIRMPERIGKYLVEDELGRGAMGVVYRAVHEYTQREVALKVLSEEVGDSDMGAERFRREVSVSARVDDDGIIQVFDAGRLEGTFYYAMELLEGCELADVMGEVDPDRGLALLADAAESLGACHEAGIVHRDLKPANIFLPDDSPPTKLLDFGVASVRDATRATQSGFTLGTPHYMSPEQARDARSVTPASDVWSLGVIAYEIVTGQLPFEGDSAMNVMLSVVQEPPDRLPESEAISSKLREVVDGALAKEPAERISGAGEFARRLREVERVAEVDLASMQGPAPTDKPSVEAYRTDIFETDQAPNTDEGVGQAPTVGSDSSEQPVGGPTREESADERPIEFDRTMEATGEGPADEDLNPPTADGGEGDQSGDPSFWGDVGLLARVAAGLAALFVAGIVGIYLTGGSDADQPRATTTGPDAGAETAGDPAASLERARRAVTRGRRTGHVAVAGETTAREVEASLNRLRQAGGDASEAEPRQTGTAGDSSGGRPPAAGDEQNDDSPGDDTSGVGTATTPSGREESGGRESDDSTTTEDGEPSERAGREASSADETDDGAEEGAATSGDDAETDLPDPSTLGDEDPSAGEGTTREPPAAEDESGGPTDESDSTRTTGEPDAGAAGGQPDAGAGGGETTTDEQKQADQPGGAADESGPASDDQTSDDDQNDQEAQDDEDEPGFIQF